MKKYMTRREAETAKKRAASFVEHVLDDSDHAQEIDDLDLDSWAEKRGVIINPSHRRKIMATERSLRKLSKDELVDRVMEVEEENSTLTEKLDEINSIVTSEDDSDDEDDDSDDED